MKQKKILKDFYVVLGGSYEQLPLIERLKSDYKEFKVLTFDKHKDSPASKISDKFVKIDIRDYKKIFNYIRLNNIIVKGISSIITEHSIKTINYLSPKLNLPKTSIISVKATESKYFARNLFKNIFDGKIKFIRTNNYINLKKFLKKKNIKKFVLKPDISSGQRGLFLIDKKKNNFKKLFNMSKKFSLNKKVIIEEYLDGIELNAVAMIKNYKIIKYIISKRNRYTKPGLGFGIAYNHDNPFQTSNSIRIKIEKILNKMCKKSKIKNGIIFPQFILTGNRVYLIEFSERVPGGLMDKVFEYSTGIDLNKFQIDCSLSKVKSIKHYQKFKVFKYVKIEFLNGPPGFLKSGNVKMIKGINQILRFKHVHEADLFYSGTTYDDYNKLKINKLNFSKDRFFYVLYGSNILFDIKSERQKVLKTIQFIGDNNRSMLSAD